MDLICYSHLRWNFVYQRPQHLISRFARMYRTFYIEEAIPIEDDVPSYKYEQHDNLYVIVPLLPFNISEAQTNTALTLICDQVVADFAISPTIAWYYTPMALTFSRQHKAEIVVYDCMDELSHFKFAPPELTKLEKELFELADVVFTGGYSLYNAKKDQHKNVYAFPSSIDKDHFAVGRTFLQDPEDQSEIPHPRFGFFGVLDERFNVDLIREVADQRPDWHFVLIGPVVKIDPATLPVRDNIHLPGSKSYDKLPGYLAGWDVAMIPFLLNDSTKYISPTKTPEYLAAGKPVISSAITDVIEPYGNHGLVSIANTPDEFIAAGETLLQLDAAQRFKWLELVDKFIRNNSWDDTWQQMNEIINIAIKTKQSKSLSTTKIEKHV